MNVYDSFSRFKEIPKVATAFATFGVDLRASTQYRTHSFPFEPFECWVPGGGAQGFALAVLGLELLAAGTGLGSGVANRGNIG